MGLELYEVAGPAGLFLIKFKVGHCWCVGQLSPSLSHPTAAILRRWARRFEISHLFLCWCKYPSLPGLGSTPELELELGSTPTPTPELELELELKPLELELELELIFWKFAWVGVGVETPGVGVGVDILEIGRSWSCSWNLWSWELELELKFCQPFLYSCIIWNMTLKAGSITLCLITRPLCLTTRQSVLHALPFLKFWNIRIVISLILFKQYKVRSFVHLDHRGIVLRSQRETERVCMS